MVGLFEAHGLPPWVLDQPAHVADWNGQCPCHVLPPSWLCSPLRDGLLVDAAPGEVLGALDVHAGLASPVRISVR